MLFLIPHLFAEPAWVERALGNLRLTALETLRARGRLAPAPGDGIEAALCEALAIPRQADCPIAPITLEADGGTAGSAYWLRADPVHVQVLRDHLVLAGSTAFELSTHEADALAHSIAGHFGATLSPIPLHPKRWYVCLESAPRLVTTPLSVAAGSDIARHMPQGEDAPVYRRLINELQMLLFDHPVNRAREARGEWPVNSIWLWGGGQRPTRGSNTLRLFANGFEAAALGGFAGAEVLPLPDRFRPDSFRSDGIILLDQLTTSGQYRDAFGWREAMKLLERDWFAPLLQNLRKLDTQGASLFDPVNGTALQLKRADAWKFWRRP